MPAFYHVIEITERCDQEHRGIRLVWRRDGDRAEECLARLDRREFLKEVSLVRK